MFTYSTSLSDFANLSSQRAAFAKMEASGKLWPKNDKGVRISKKKHSLKASKKNTEAKTLKFDPYKTDYQKEKGSLLKPNQIVIPAKGYGNISASTVLRVKRVHSKSTTFEFYSETFGTKEVKINHTEQPSYSMFSSDEKPETTYFYIIPHKEAQKSVIGNDTVIENEVDFKTIKTRKRDLKLVGNFNSGFYWVNQKGYYLDEYGDMEDGKPNKSDTASSPSEASVIRDVIFKTHGEQPLNDFFSDFGSIVIKEAKKFIGCKEDKGTPNRSMCVDKILQLGGWTPNNEPWCAAFVYAIVEKSCNILGVTNKLPRTKSTRSMLNNAPGKGLKVDKNPAVGSVFFIPRGDNGTQGHVGIVIDVKGDQIFTVEGNLSDSVRLGQRKIFSEMRFIHVEDMTTEKYISIGKKIAIGLILSGGAYYGIKKFT